MLVFQGSDFQREAIVTVLKKCDASTRQPVVALPISTNPVMARTLCIQMAEAFHGSTVRLRGICSRPFPRAPPVLVRGSRPTLYNTRTNEALWRLVFDARPTCQRGRFT